MDFILFPLDVQKCPIDFSSCKSRQFLGQGHSFNFTLFLFHTHKPTIDKYSLNEMTFQWKQENPLSFPKDFGEGFFRLPKYIVTFRTRDEPYIINYGDGKFVFL